MSYTWARQGDIRPVEARHAIAAKKLVNPGGQPVYPISEEACDVMAAEIERIDKLDREKQQQQRTPVSDQAMRDARDEFLNHVGHYTGFYTSIIERQKRLKARPRTPESAILGEVSDDLFAAPLTTQQMLDRVFGRVPRGVTEIAGHLYTPTFNTVAETKAATLKVIAATHSLEPLSYQLTQSEVTYNASPEELNRRLILALAKKIDLLRLQVAELENKQLKRRLRA